MTTLELQFFEIIALDFTAVEARVFVDGNCSRIFRNFDEADCRQSLFPNQKEYFEFASEQAAVAFLTSARRYAEVAPE